MKVTLSGCIKYGFLLIVSFFSIFPFYWMMVGSTNTANQVAEGKLTFGNQLASNFQVLFSNYDIPLIMWNSIKVSLITVLVSLLVTSLAAFGFEKFRTRASEGIYAVFLLCMMVPLATLVIPLFKMMAGMQLVNQHVAVILPLVNNLFLIFFFRQNFKSFPDGILDASRIEGATE
ncbi:MULTISPECIES: carbohydrate ABC transporter permease [unclassified Enterococcus]|nr:MULTISPECIES: hypothetical protein [unclassified Enterococcus]